MLSSSWTQLTRYHCPAICAGTSNIPAWHQRRLFHVKHWQPTPGRHSTRGTLPSPCPARSDPASCTGRVTHHTRRHRQGGVAIRVSPPLRHTRTGRQMPPRHSSLYIYRTQSSSYASPSLSQTCSEPSSSPTQHLAKLTPVNQSRTLPGRNPLTPTDRYSNCIQVVHLFAGEPVLASLGPSPRQRSPKC